MNADVLRLFIALPLPEAVTAALEACGQALSRLLPAGSVRWVPAARMHLTLSFLGDTPAARLPLLREALDDVAARSRTTTLVLGRLGCFPNERRPAVFWAGLDSDPVPLQALQGALIDALVPLGWTRDPRPFSPHITLGRVRRGARVAFPVPPPVPPPLTCELDRLELVHSEQGAHGRRYRVLHTGRLPSAH